MSLRRDERRARPAAAAPRRPLDPSVIRFIEALARADARRDHRAAQAETAKTENRVSDAPRSDLR